VPIELGEIRSRQAGQVPCCEALLPFFARASTWEGLPCTYPILNVEYSFLPGRQRPGLSVAYQGGLYRWLYNLTL